MSDEIAGRIRQILADYLGINPGRVTRTALFTDDLGIDSVDAIELIMAFEEAFEVVIPEAAAATIITVQDAVDYIEQQKSG